MPPPNDDRSRPYQVNGGTGSPIPKAVIPPHRLAAALRHIAHPSSSQSLNVGVSDTTVDARLAHPPSRLGHTATGPASVLSGDNQADSARHLLVRALTASTTALWSFSVMTQLNAMAHACLICWSSGCR